MVDLRSATANRLCDCNHGTPTPPFPAPVLPISVF